MKIYLLELLGGKRLVADYQRYSFLRKCGFFKLFIFLPEFRIQVIYRMSKHSKIFSVLFKPLKLFNFSNLYINCPDIEEGLFIEHGFSTVISCKHIGKNC